jgi:outer membrane protein OmpA-like peptidoglycan-associated protein
MNFKLKQCLVGIAAASSIAPLTALAQTSPGQYIHDGFSRATKDGGGSTCVNAGGSTHAFDVPDCTSAAESAKQARDATFTERKAMREEKRAAESAAREAAPPPLGSDSTGVVKRSDSGALKDGFGRTCVRHGAGEMTGSCEAASAAVKDETAAAVAAAAAAKEARMKAAADAPLTTEPGSALNGGKGAYVHDGANGAVTRDSFGRSCVKDSRWDVSLATEDCAPDLYAKWRAQNAPVVAGGDNLARRVQSAPPEVPVPTDQTQPAQDLARRQAAAAPEVLPDREPGVVPAETKIVETAPIIDNTLPTFPIVPYLPQQADSLADDDRAMPEDDAADDDMPDVYAEDEETTPAMMMSDEDRALPPDQLADNEPVDQTQPDPELASRTTMPPPEVPIARADDLDRSPGVAPATESKAEAKSVVDNTLPDFPVTKNPAPSEPVAVVDEKKDPTPPAKKEPDAPMSLPVTIQVQGDGLFDFDQTVLKSPLIVKLDQVADLLTGTGTKYDSISIVGHTDPIGNAKYNQALSERRAEAAKKYLVGKGVDGGRISTSGKGEGELVVKRADCAGKKGKAAYIACLEPNRRIVIDGKASKPAP